MAYSKQTWDTTSYVNPTRMNHIENGIKANSDTIGELDTEEATTVTTSYGDIVYRKYGHIVRAYSDGTLKNLPASASVSLGNAPYGAGYAFPSPAYSSAAPYTPVASSWLSGTSLTLYKPSNVSQVYINFVYTTT